jgi:carboxymethylenebutenolidase
VVEDWIANAYEGMSRRQFLVRMSAAGASLADFAIAASPVAGEAITTPAEGLKIAEEKASSRDFQIPIYEVHPAGPGKYPVVLVIPEIFGMHEHIKEITRRFAKKGYLSITFEPYAREGGVLHLPDIESVRKTVRRIWAFLWPTSRRWSALSKHLARRLSS